MELLPVVDCVTPDVEEDGYGIGEDGEKKSVIRCCPVLKERALLAHELGDDGFGLLLRLCGGM